MSRVRSIRPTSQARYGSHGGPREPCKFLRRDRLGIGCVFCCCCCQNCSRRLLNRDSGFFGVRVGSGHHFLETSNVIWPSPTRSSTRIFSICAQHDRRVFVSARSALDRSPPPTHAIVTRARAHADMYALAHLVRRNIAGLKRTPKLGGVNCATYKRFADGVIKVQSRASCRLGPRETNCH